MPIPPAVQHLVADAQIWRRDIHQNPELLYDVELTAKYVADRLSAFGCDEVKTSIGRTGVVGVIRGAKGASARAIGLRADMDALPIEEATNLPYRSRIPGKMHACGHDGHTAMLLGAARRLAETRNFAGNAVVIFQPAEEGGAGAMAMIDDGLMDRFGIEEVYGMHNWPALPIGSFMLRQGPVMAAADEITVTIEGQGGHAAMPHQCVDPVVLGAQIVLALQTIASRNVDPLDACVVSVTRFEAGAASNIIPQSAWLNGTVRTLQAATRDLAEKRIREIAAGLAAAAGGTARVEYRRGYPATVNHAAQTEFAAKVARKVVGESRVDSNVAPVMGAEDFSFMLEARPGAFIFLGNGDSAKLHHPAYDFNDAALPYGMSYWVELVETALAP
ncbi:MAG: M20 aminoacylase family protein [Roseiarcus sp.]|uniref:M20 aminoacylase family protein n=1 Tax=Roseiarcus sp. TaxID=1969460 RepID=UPI003C3DC9F4